MANVEVIRGDTYGIRRPFFIITLVDDAAQPFDLTGCTVRTTYKEAKTDPATDPTDTDAPIKHEIVINGSGVVTSQDGLFLQSTAAAGVLIERLTSAESLALPLNVQLISDVEVTDGNGEKFTVPSVDTVSAIDGVTNRTA